MQQGPLPFAFPSAQIQPSKSCDSLTNSPVRKSRKTLAGRGTVPKAPAIINMISRQELARYTDMY